MTLKTYDPLPKTWLSDYDDFIDENIPAALVNLGDRYDIVDRDGNTLEWKEFLKRIAYAESSFDCSNVYSETAIDDANGEQAIDQVTKLPLTSNGLFQISQQDALVEFHKDDERSACCTDCEGDLIFQPLHNLLCAMNIMAALVDHHPDLSAHDALGKYWSSIRRRAYLDPIDS